MTTAAPPTRKHPPEQQSRRERSIIYIVLAVAFAVLLVVALVVHRSRENEAEAQQKATQLISAINSTGGRATLLTPERVAGVLGTDGGATCADPADALGRSALFSALTNGAGGPGARPIIADSRLIQGQLLIIQIYCPDKLTDFRNMVNDLKLDNTVKP
jgi:hypothetical protein